MYMQAGHEIIFQCEIDAGAQQVTFQSGSLCRQGTPEDACCFLGKIIKTLAKSFYDFHHHLLEACHIQQI